MNQVRDRFGLCQVDAAIEKCTAREFPGLGQSRAVRQRGIQHQFGRKNAAMTGDFHHVLARECARRAHHGDQHFINGFSVAHDVAELNRVRIGGGRFQRIFSDRRKNFVGDD